MTVVVHPLGALDTLHQVLVTAAPVIDPCARRQGKVQMETIGKPEDSMPSGKIKMFNEDRGFGFINPDDGGNDVFFHVSALREGDKITVGKVVTFEVGTDAKTGKSKAVSVDLE